MARGVRHESALLPDLSTLDPVPERVHWPVRNESTSGEEQDDGCQPQVDDRRLPAVSSSARDGQEMYRR